MWVSSCPRMWVGTAEFKEMASKASNANAPAKPAPKSKKRPRAPVDSSDEEADDADDDEVDSSDDEAASDGEESGEREEDEGEETCEGEAIHGKKGKGKSLKYLVEWVGWEEKTWEPAALLTNNIVLKAWLKSEEQQRTASSD